MVPNLTITEHGCQTLEKLMAEKEEGVVVEGIVSENLKNGFRIKLCPPEPDSLPKEDAQIILGHLAGKMRMNNIKIVPGDRVKVELSPYDLTRGRITYRIQGQ